MKDTRIYTLRNKSAACTNALSMAWWATLGVAVAVFYAMSCLTTLKGDDIMYTMIMGSGGKSIRSVADLLQSQAFHYIDNNGRLANFLAQLFCGLLGKAAFDVANALMFGLMLVLVQKLALGRRSLVALAATLLYAVLFFPYPGQTMLWLTGSLNYMWAATLTLLFLWWLRRAEQRGGRCSAATHVAALALSAMAGAMNESVTLGVAAGLCLYYAVNRKRFRGVVVTACAGYALGVLVILCSPGAWARMAETEAYHASLLTMLTRRGLNIFFKTGHYVFPALAMLGFMWQMRSQGVKAVLRSQWLCVFLGVVLCMVVFSETKARVYTFYSLFSFVVVMRQASQLMPRLAGKAKLAVVAALMVAAAVPSAMAGKQIVAYKHYDKAIVAAMRASGKQCVLEASDFPESRFVYPNVYNSLKFSAYTTIFCQFYHKSNIAFLPKALYQRYMNGNIEAGSQALSFASNCNEVASKVLAYKNEDFAVVPINDADVYVDINVKFEIADMSQLIGKEKARKSYYWGELRDYQRRYWCRVRQGGKLYAILPGVQASVIAIEVPLVRHGKPYTLRFVRTQAANKVLRNDGS